MRPMRLAGGAATVGASGRMRAAWRWAPGFALIGLSMVACHAAARAGSGRRGQDLPRRVSGSAGLSAADSGSGMQEDTITVGVTRRYRLYVPAAAATPPTALVIALHGGGGEGLQVTELGRHPLSVFRTVADREGFVVAYPEGWHGRDDRAAWVDCRADNRAATAVDDVAFLTALIERLQRRFGVPVARVFMVGSSNGGQMTLAFALRAADRVAAVAAGEANLPASPLPGGCTTGPTRPVPILLVHGASDPAMPYAGGCVANLGGACNRGRVIGAEATRDFFLVRNGLATTPTRTDTVDVDPDDGGPAERHVYDGAAPVEWWRMVGGGHPPPSRTTQRGESAATGRQNHDVEFAEIVWSFFKAVMGG